MLHNSVERVALEPIRLSMSTVLPRADISAHYDYEVQQRIATITAHFLGREIVREGKSIDVPLSGWDSIKDGLNQWLIRLDQWLDRHGLWTIRRRCKFQTKQVSVQSVYHICPHLGEGRREHCAMFITTKPENAHQTRCLHYIHHLVEQGIRDMSPGALFEIRHILKTYGALT